MFMNKIMLQTLSMETISIWFHRQRMDEIMLYDIYISWFYYSDSLTLHVEISQHIQIHGLAWAKLLVPSRWFWKNSEVSFSTWVLLGALCVTCWVQFICLKGGLPFGKLTWQWKIPIFNRNTSSKGGFSIAMLIYRSVVQSWLMLISLFKKRLPKTKIHQRVAGLDRHQRSIASYSI